MPEGSGVSDEATRDGLACQWCRQPIRARARRDSLYCSQSHRQAAWRFNSQSRTGVGQVGETSRQASRVAGRYAYADPPYPGLAARYYRDHADFGGEVDHAELVRRLTAEYDGWALSTSAAALQDVLAVCPAGVRVAAWLRGARGGASYLPQQAWEPVVYYRARAVLGHGETARVDALHYVLRPRLADPFRCAGSKPATFCSWLFALLGLQPDDDLVDLFPGSGRVGEAWETYRRDPIRVSPRVATGQGSRTSSTMLATTPSARA